ncbi:MAG: glycosyltransferase family 4 protein [Verrucomicrobiota bacterium]|nr:glycosyltransferase family 4 protein [Verrucomicrobiota bacterium]
MTATVQTNNGPGTDHLLDIRAKSLRWIVAQEGSRQSYAIPFAFHKLGQLRLMCTDVWCGRARHILKRGPAGARALAGRYESHLLPEQVVAFNLRGIVDKAIYHFRRNHLNPEGHAAQFIRFGKWFSKRVTRHLARIELDPARDCYFGFNTNALETMEHLKKRGIFTLLDQVDPGKVEEDLVLEESARWPGWEKAPGRLPQAYWDRLKAEWDLADVVLVNSQWSCDALLQQGVPRNKIIIVPLAIDLSLDRETRPVHPSGPLKVLWLGSLILRKGIQYLVEAARRLENSNIEFIFAGPVGLSRDVVRSFPSNMKLLGRVTRDEIHQIYRSAHVFVLPTLSDGFAITQLEAMANGLPVITTPNCGQVVTHGVDGLIVPPRDAEALAEAIVRLDRDREALYQMSYNSLSTISRYDLPSNARMINNYIVPYRSNPALYRA